MYGIHNAMRNDRRTMRGLDACVGTGEGVGRSGVDMKIIGDRINFVGWLGPSGIRKVSCCTNSK